MSKISHTSIFIFSLGLAIICGGLDYETHSMLDLFLNKENIVALIIYTLLFMAVTFAFFLEIIDLFLLCWRVNASIKSLNAFI